MLLLHDQQFTDLWESGAAGATVVHLTNLPSKPSCAMSSDICIPRELLARLLADHATLVAAQAPASESPKMPTLPRLPAYIYGRETSKNEKVFTEQALLEDRRQVLQALIPSLAASLDAHDALAAPREKADMEADHALLLRALEKGTSTPSGWCSLGVGRGDGQLLVHGPYEAIKACQALMERQSALPQAGASEGDRDDTAQILQDLGDAAEKAYEILSDGQLGELDTAQAQEALDMLGQALRQLGEGRARPRAPTINQWPQGRCVGRKEDMSPTGRLEVMLDGDNDVIVHVCKGDTAENWESASVEFCTASTGGGSSVHTRAALISLMVAIEQDNQASPRRAYVRGQADDQVA